MPYYHFKKIWTPLEIIGLKFFRETDKKELWYSFRSKRKRPLFR